MIFLLFCRFQSRMKMMYRKSEKYLWNRSVGASEKRKKNWLKNQPKTADWLKSLDEDKLGD